MHVLAAVGVVLVSLGFFLLVVVYYYSFLKEVLSKDAPYVGSFDRQLTLIGKYLLLIPGKNLLDLGCGDGKAMRRFERHFKLSEIQGYEKNRIAIWIGKLLNRRWYHSKIKLIHDDFSQAPLHDFKYLYLYLFPQHLEKIEEWIFSNVRDDAWIISNSFRFTRHQPVMMIQNSKGIPIIYVYHPRGKLPEQHGEKWLLK